MIRTGLLTISAMSLFIGIGTANAQGRDELPPERAPPALRDAPPSIIAPPMNAGEIKPDKPETSGQAVPKLVPDQGQNTRTDGDMKGPSR